MTTTTTRKTSPENKRLRRLFCDYLILFNNVGKVRRFNWIGVHVAELNIDT